MSAKVHWPLLADLTGCSCSAGTSAFRSLTALSADWNHSPRDDLGVQFLLVCNLASLGYGFSSPSAVASDERALSAGDELAFWKGSRQPPGRNHRPSTLSRENPWQRDEFGQIWPPKGKYEDADLGNVANLVRDECGRTTW